VFVERPGQHHFARKCRSEKSDLDYHVVAGRDELGLGVNAQGKNRRSHPSQRNGLTKIMPRILRSVIPVRFADEFVDCSTSANSSLRFSWCDISITERTLCCEKACSLCRFEHWHPIASPAKRHSGLALPARCSGFHWDCLTS
jgi:hypothetical protein